MNSISSLISVSTWQGWGLSSSMSVLGYETEETDLLGADFLSGADSDLVTLSAEAQAVLDAQEGASDTDSTDLSSIMEELSASQVASLSLTVSSGEVLTAMLDDLDSLDLLSGLTA